MMEFDYSKERCAKLADLEGDHTVSAGGPAPFLRWHRLTELRRGDQVTELLAATCDDGIGIIARWALEEDGTWFVETMDTESRRWRQVRDFGEDENIPALPPTVFDDLLIDSPVGERAREGVSATPETDAIHQGRLGKPDFVEAYKLMHEHAKKLEQQRDLARVPICVGRPIIEILAEQGQWEAEGGNVLIAASCLFKNNPYATVGDCKAEAGTPQGAARRGPA